MDLFSFVLDFTRIADLNDHRRDPGQPSNEPWTKHPDIGLKAAGFRVNWQTTRY